MSLISIPPKISRISKNAMNNALVSLTLEHQFKVLSKLFSSLLHRSSTTHMCSVPDDFLKLAANGMAHLHKCNHSNVIYFTCQALGTMEPDQSDSQKDANGLDRIHGGFFYCQTYQRGRHVPLILLIVLMYICNRLNVPLTIALGSRRCMCFLEQNGSKYSMDLYGTIVLYVR